MIKASDIKMCYPISKWFKKEFKTSLYPLSVHFLKGESVSILGANGAGKTTFLKLIGGVLFPTEGSVKINGFDTVKDERQVKTYVSFVFNEERSFFWRLTGYQNLEFFGHLDKFPKSILKERILYYLHKLGLDKEKDRPVSTYSSGMRQRLSLVRGLIPQSAVLILDEPTRTLDPRSREDVWNILDLEYLKKDKTLLLASHNFLEAETLSHKFLVFSNGVLINYGTSKGIEKRYNQQIKERSSVENISCIHKA
jgi:ABC-2 type transport system ATP-binding protein